MTERKAFVAAIVEEGEEIFLMVGAGDHDCDRWKLSRSLLRKLMSEGLRVFLNSPETI